jgi:hypothetical protein
MHLSNIAIAPLFVFLLVAGAVAAVELLRILLNGAN